MPFGRQHADQNPVLLMTARSDDKRRALSRMVLRVWHAPEFWIGDDVRSALDYLVGRRLQGSAFNPDIMIVDLDGCSASAARLFETVRTLKPLRHAPLVALVDACSAAIRDATYDAGADLVIYWEKLDSRTGDIAGLVVGNWLNTEPFDDDARKRA